MTKPGQCWRGCYNLNPISQDRVFGSQVWSWSTTTNTRESNTAGNVSITPRHCLSSTLGTSPYLSLIVRAETSEREKSISSLNSLQSNLLQSRAGLEMLHLHRQRRTEYYEWIYRREQSRNSAYHIFSLSLCHFQSICVLLIMIRISSRLSPPSLPRDFKFYTH